MVVAQLRILNQVKLLGLRGVSQGRVHSHQNVLCWWKVTCPIPGCIFIFYLCVCHSHCSLSVILQPLFSFNSFYSAINLCFLYTTPDPLPPFFSPFLALLLPLIYSFDQYSPLYLLPCFPSQFFFNIVTFHSPLICPCYFPLCSIFVQFCQICNHRYHLFTLSQLQFYERTVQCRLTDVDFAMSVPLLSILYLLPLGAFLLLSHHQYSSSANASPSSFLLPCSSSFLYFLVFLGTEPAQWK